MASISLWPSKGWEGSMAKKKKINNNYQKPTWVLDPYRNSNFIAQFLLNVQPFLRVHARIGLRILIDQNEEEDAPHGSHGSEHVKYGGPTQGALGQQTAQGHGYDRSKLCS